MKTTSPTEEKEKFKSPKRRKKKKLKITNIHMELINISEFSQTLELICTSMKCPRKQHSYNSEFHELQ
jgi:hypothetical protein